MHPAGQDDPDQAQKELAAAVDLLGDDGRDEARHREGGGNVVEQGCQQFDPFIVYAIYRWRR